MTDSFRAKSPPPPGPAWAQLEQILEEIPAAVSVTRGPEHHVEYLNPLSRVLTGGREVLGRTMREAYPELAGQGYFELMDRVYATGEPYRSSEARVAFDREGDGTPEEAYFDFSYQPLFGPAGEVSGILRFAVEVTAAVRARAAADAARAEAEDHAAETAQLAAQVQEQSTQLQEQAAELQEQLAEAQAMSEELELANQELLEAQHRAESATAEEAATIETLHRIGTSLAAELDLQKIVQIATDETTRITGAQFGAFFYNVLNQEGESYTLYTLSGVPREAFSKFPMPRNTAVFGPTFRGEGVVRSDDITRDPRYGRNAPYHGMPRGHLPVRSYLAVPVLSRTGEVLGGLFYGHAEAGVFTRRSERVASGVAGWAGLAIDNARLHERETRAREATERGAERLRRLLEVADALGRAVSPAQVAEVVVEKGMEEVGAQAGSLALLGADGGEFHTVASRGYPAASEERFHRYPVQAGRPLSDVVLGRENALLLESYAQWEARYPEMEPAVRETGYPAFAGVPIVSGGKPVGALAFSFAAARGFDEGIATFMRALAGHCATALERARLYEEERAARADAEAANQAKSQFLANMSHELRTPLNAIAGYTELLEMGLRGPVTGEQQADLERIRRAQQHLLGLINDVLNFAKLEAGRIEFDVREIELDEVLANVEALTTPQAQAAGLTLAVDCAEPLRALADPDKLEQVLLNLISNAIKFTAPGGRVEIECRAEGDAVRLSVRDSGVGVPPERLTDIFDPFVQVDPDLTRKRQGAGLGLAISRELARAMGGEIVAESRPGVGSTFTLTLRPAGG
jgi:signal transduction histidine kinase